MQAGIGWLPMVMPRIADVPSPRQFRDYVDLYDKASETIRTSMRMVNTSSGHMEPFHYAITG